jgi:hypothetical protein
LIQGHADDEERRQEAGTTLLLGGGVPFSHWPVMLDAGVAIVMNDDQF